MPLELIGNPGIQPFKIVSAEGGVQFNFDRFRFLADYWTTDSQNESFQAAPGLPVTFLGKARRDGFDLDGRFDVVKGGADTVSVFANFGAVRARLLDAAPSLLVPNVPNYVANVGVDFNVATFNAQAVSGSAYVTFVGKKNLTQDGLITTQPYSRVTGKLAYSWPGRLDRVHAGHLVSRRSPQRNRDQFRRSGWRILGRYLRQRATATRRVGWADLSFPDRDLPGGSGPRVVHQMKSRAIRIVLRALVVTAATFSFEAASAHDVWLTLAGDAAARRAIINYGHPDDRPPAIADKVLDLFEIKSGDRASPLAGLEGVQRDGVLVVQSEPFADDGHILLAVRYDNGYWIKTVGGLYRNATRRLAPDAVDSVWSSKFAKALTGPGAPWQTVLGHDFEIVPLSDPATIKPRRDTAAPRTVSRPAARRRRGRARRRRHVITRAGYSAFQDRCRGCGVDYGRRAGSTSAGGRSSREAIGYARSGQRGSLYRDAMVRDPLAAISLAISL